MCMYLNGRPHGGQVLRPVRTYVLWTAPILRRREKRGREGKNFFFCTSLSSCCRSSDDVTRWCRCKLPPNDGPLQLAVSGRDVFLLPYQKDCRWRLAGHPGSVVMYADRPVLFMYALSASYHPEHAVSSPRYL